MESTDELEGASWCFQSHLLLVIQVKNEQDIMFQSWTPLATGKNSQQTKDSLWLNTFDPIFKISVDKK